MRENAISVLGTKLGRFWFDFSDRRIKVPYTRELGPSAGDVDSNGNDVDTDECTLQCTAAICGDGVVHEGVEECDDGNDIDVDDCLVGCLAAKCGDGVVHELLEGCDDGNNVDNDACSNKCIPASCGDAVVQIGEQCDDGNKFDDDDCTTLCNAATCGDGFVHTGVEQCDDAGESNVCDADCTPAMCGDAVLNVKAGETCDDGGFSPTCDADCTPAVCGDKVINTKANETCDDGMETVTCDSDCTAPMCGDGVVNKTAGEVCDTSGESPSCNANCTPAKCGDGVLNMAAGEQCDDGNNAEGDGCSSTCKAHKVVFVSSVPYDGNMGGLPGADAKCQALATAVGLKGTFLAWLSDNTGSPSTRFTKSAIPYVRRDGVLVANNWTDLTDGAIANSIGVSELGLAPGVGPEPCGNLVGLTRTNTATNGGQYNAALSCNNWSSNAANLITGGGHYFSANANWTAYVCAQFCSWKKPIYCVEQ